MSNEISIKIEGIEYPSISAALKAYGNNMLVYRRRISLGWDKIRAVTTPIGFKASVVVGGRNFRSLKEAADEFKVSISTLRRNIEKGWSPGTKLPKNATSKEIELEGIRYFSLEEAYKAYGISRQAVNLRLKRGMSLEEAIISRKKMHLGGNSKKVMINGVEYKSIKEACQKLGLNYSTVCARKNYVCCYKNLSHGQIIEDMLEGENKKRKLRGRQGNKININGVGYKSIKEACQKLGLNLSNVYKEKHHSINVEYEDIIKRILEEKNGK